MYACRRVFLLFVCGTEKRKRRWRRRAVGILVCMFKVASKDKIYVEVLTLDVVLIYMYSY